MYSQAKCSFPKLLQHGLIKRSLLIQAADTYIHVTIEAIEVVQSLAQPSMGHDYSRGLAPWCLNRPTFGHSDNPNYWSCGIAVFQYPRITYVQPTNNSLVQSVGLGLSKTETVLHFVDIDGTHTAILAPRNTPANIDYSASSYGVSMQCRFIRTQSCIMEDLDFTGSDNPLSRFNCSENEVGLSISGNIYPIVEQLYQYDFHRLIQEPTPFFVSSRHKLATQAMLDVGANISDAEAGTIFRNPWRIFTAINVQTKGDSPFNTSDSKDVVFRTFAGAFVMISCNSTGTCLQLRQIKVVRLKI